MGLPSTETLDRGKVTVELRRGSSEMSETNSTPCTRDQIRQVELRRAELLLEEDEEGGTIIDHMVEGAEMCRHMARVLESSERASELVAKMIRSGVDQPVDPNITPREMVERLLRKAEYCDRMRAWLISPVEGPPPR